MTASLWLVGAALLTWGIGEGMFMLFVPLYLEQLGADPVGIGSVLGLFGLMMMIVHIPAGYLADRVGRKPLLVAAWALGAAAAVVMALARSLPLFVAGYLGYGLTAFVSSPMFSYVTAARGRLSPGRAMTFTSAAFALGAVVGPLAGGWVGEHYGLRLTFAIAAVIFVISTAMIVFLRAQPRQVHPAGETRPALLSPAYLRMIAVLFVASFAMFLAQPLTPNFLQNERRVSLEVIGWIGSAGSIGNVFFNLALGRGRPRRGFLFGQALVAAFVLLIWAGAALPWYVLGYFLLGGFRAARILGFAQVRLLIHDAHMGLAYGITEAANALGMLLAPLAAGLLYAQRPASMYPTALALLTFSVITTSVLAPSDAAAQVAPADPILPEGLG